MKEDHIFLLCECSSEGLFVEPYADDFNFAVFRNYTYKNNLWCRIKYAWWHLRTGKKHNDQICLGRDKAQQLAKFINDNI